MEATYDQCFGQITSRIANAQNREECPTQDQVMADLTAEYSDDACMLFGIGWINEDGEWDEATIGEDLMSLDEGLVEGLDQEGWESCVAEQTEFWANHPCADQYDETVEHVGKMVVEYECFKHFFESACYDHLSDMYSEYTN